MIGEAIIVALALVAVAHILGCAAVERKHFDVSRDVQIAKMRYERRDDDRDAVLAKRIADAESGLATKLEALERRVNEAKAKEIAKKMGGG